MADRCCRVPVPPADEEPQPPRMGPAGARDAGRAAQCADTGPWGQRRPPVCERHTAKAPVTRTVGRARCLPSARLFQALPGHRDLHLPQGSEQMTRKPVSSTLSTAPGTSFRKDVLLDQELTPEPDCDSMGPP